MAFQILRLLVDEADAFCLYRSKGTIIICRMFCYPPIFVFYRMPFRYSMSNLPNMSSTNSDLLPAS